MSTSPDSFQQQNSMLSKLAERVKVFKGMSPHEVSLLLNAAEKCIFEPDEIIVREGTIGQNMFIIIDGEVVVSKKGYDGESEIARITAPNSFGEMALADNAERSASVTAHTRCIVLKLNDRAMNNQPELGVKVYRNIARVLSERLRQADEAIAWRL